MCLKEEGRRPEVGEAHCREQSRAFFDGLRERHAGLDQRADEAIVAGDQCSVGRGGYPPQVLGLRSVRGYALARGEVLARNLVCADLPRVAAEGCHRLTQGGECTMDRHDGDGHHSAKPSRHACTHPRYEGREQVNSRGTVEVAEKGDSAGCRKRDEHLRRGSHGVEGGSFVVGAMLHRSEGDFDAKPDGNHDGVQPSLPEQPRDSNESESKLSRDVHASRELKEHRACRLSLGVYQRVTGWHHPQGRRQGEVAAVDGGNKCIRSACSGMGATVEQRFNSPGGDCRACKPACDAHYRRASGCAHPLPPRPCAHTSTQGMTSAGKGAASTPHAPCRQRGKGHVRDDGRAVLCDNLNDCMKVNISGSQILLLFFTKQFDHIHNQETLDHVWVKWGTPNLKGCLRSSLDIMCRSS